MTRNGDCHVQRNYMYACKWPYPEGQNYFPFSISSTTKIHPVVQRAWCLPPLNFRILCLKKFWPGFLPFPWWLPLSLCSVDDYLVNLTPLKLSWMFLVVFHQWWAQVWLKNLQYVCSSLMLSQLVLNNELKIVTKFLLTQKAVLSPPYPLS